MTKVWDLRSGGRRRRSPAGVRPQSLGRLVIKWIGASVVAGGSLTAGGCSTDIFDVAVVLGTQQFPVDFGTQSGTIPPVPCTVQDVSVCGNSQAVPVTGELGQAEIMVGCDAALARCYAQANARLTYPVDVLQDDGFTSKVGRRAVSIVRMLDITYAVPVNTTTFDVPRMDVYVGPAGARTEADVGVELVDSIPAVARATVVPASDPRHLVVADGSPARDLMERNIRAKTPFVVIVALSPRIESGDPVPGGRLQVEMVPVLGLGLR